MDRIYNFYTLSFGGKGGTVVLVARPHPNYADFAQPDKPFDKMLTEALGTKAAATALMAHIDTTLDVAIRSADHQVPSGLELHSRCGDEISFIFYGFFRAGPIGEFGPAGGFAEIYFQPAVIPAFFHFHGKLNQWIRSQHSLMNHIFRRIRTARDR